MICEKCDKEVDYPLVLLGWCNDCLDTYDGPDADGINYNVVTPREAQEIAWRQKKELR